MFSGKHDMRNLGIIIVAGAIAAIAAISAVGYVFWCLIEKIVN